MNNSLQEPKPEVDDFKVETLFQLEGPWRKALVRDWLNAADRLSLSCTCRSAQILLLSTSPKLRVALQLTNTPQDHRRVQHVQQALSARGPMQSSVSLAHDQSMLHKHQLLSTINTLATVGHHVHTLDALKCFTPADVTCTLATAFPSLHKLSIDVPEEGLVHARHLPALRELVAQHPLPQAYASISTYVPQLFSLNLTGGFTYEGVAAQQAVMPQLFRVPSYRLTTFHTDAQLDDQLLGLLVNRVPSLKDLAVGNVIVLTTAHAFRTWQVETLALTAEPSNSKRPMVRCMTLANLPQAGQGRMTVNLGQVLLCLNERRNLATSQSIVKRLLHLKFADLVDFHIYPRWSGDSPLYTLASVVRTLHPPPQSVSLVESTDRHWSMTPALVQELAALPEGIPVSVVTREWGIQPPSATCIPPRAWAITSLRLDQPLSESVCTALLHCTPALKDLTVSKVEQMSGLLAATVWNLDTLSCLADVRLNELACLPGRVTGLMNVVAPKVGFDVVDEQVADFIVKRLSFTTNTVWLALPTGVPLVAEQAVLRVNLKALAFATITNTSGKIGLFGWTMTQPLMETLAGLPAWLELGFADCTWPLSYEAYAPLLSCVPSSYSKISILPGSVTDEQLLYIALGAPRTRTPDKPLLVRYLVWPERPEESWRALGQSVAWCMERHGPYPHVTVRVQSKVGGAP